jgi:hypothetical protein
VSRRATDCSGVRVNPVDFASPFPYFDCWVLGTRGTGKGNSVVVGRAVYDLSLLDVMIGTNEK